MQEILQARLEVFPIGPDGGIDIRQLKGPSGSRYFQCKHSPNKSYADIKRSVVADSKANMAQNLKEFWFATSASLTLANKSEICELYRNQNLEADRVLARSDIDNLLNLHPAVERANYKLYLSSFAALERIFRNGAFVRQQHYVQNLVDRSKLFVQSESYAKASQVLQHEHYCVISGDPGTGKTTLADMLSLHLLDQGYSLHVIAEDISEVDDLWQENDKQVFIYDDFLGQSSLAEKLRTGEDNRFQGVLSRIRKSENKLLLMTTREYILRTAQNTYAKLNTKDFTASKIVVDLNSYTRFQRAHILYNHLHFSNLPNSDIFDFVKERGPDKVVDHKNFNPRLIETLIDTAVRALNQGEEIALATFVIESLDNPRELWLHILDNQIGEVERDLVYVLGTFQHGVDVEDLRIAVNNFRVCREQPPTGNEFKKALRVLEGVFVTVDSDGASHTVDFSNPGIKDFVVTEVLSESFLLDSLCRSVAFADQATTICSWAANRNALTGSALKIDDMARRASVDVLARNAGGLMEALGAQLSRSQEWEAKYFRARLNPEASALLLLDARPLPASRRSQLSKEIVEGLRPRWAASLGSRDHIIELLERVWARLDSDLKKATRRDVEKYLHDDKSGPGRAIYCRFLKLIGDRTTAEIELESCLAILGVEIDALLEAEDVYPATAFLDSIETQLRELGRLEQFESEIWEVQMHLEELRDRDLEPTDLDDLDIPVRQSTSEDIGALFSTIRLDQS